MEPTGKVTVNASSAETERLRRNLINDCLGQLGMAMNQEVSVERRALYCRALSDIPLTPLRFAFEEALKHAGEFLPSVQTLREYSEQWRPTDQTRQLLMRHDKPDQEPTENRAQFVANLLAEMRAKIAAGACSMPEPSRSQVSHREVLEAAIARLNGISQVPGNLAERKAWAHRKAIDSGWLPEKEPQR